jgi:hypothetical protein
MSHLLNRVRIVTFLPLTLLSEKMPGIQLVLLLTCLLAPLASTTNEGIVSILLKGAGAFIYLQCAILSGHLFKPIFIRP